jgi:hypothetical protein
MEWKSIDFQGVVNLNETLLDQLYRYLEEKETFIGLKILNAIRPFQYEAPFPSLPPDSKTKMMISEAVEGLSKKIRVLAQLKQHIDTPDDWSKAGKKISEVLWDYLETLQESVTELFQQIDQVEIEKWQPELARVVDLIKELLMHHLDDLHWAILRLENLLWEYRWLCEAQEGKWVALRKSYLIWSKIIDHSLFTNVEKCKKYLGFRYQSFSDRYERYLVLQSKINAFIDKFKSYQVFGTLESEFQEKIIKIYRLIKFWELNSKAKSLPQRDFIRSLRRMINPEKALELFRLYYNAIKNMLFDKSRQIKGMQPEQEADIKEAVAGYQSELHTLGATVVKYREFLLKTDPNPYVRSRLGFPEWFAGPEPIQAKQMLNFTYEIESLDAMIMAFKKALEEGPSEKSFESIKSEIKSVFHEMSQPLISKSIMKGRAESLVDCLERLNELGTTQSETVDLAGEVLAKGLRYDWKYHALFDIPAFHHLYAIHLGLVGSVDDRNHLNRLHKFKRLIQQIGQWIKDNDTPRHTHEIETDMNDMKVYLQDFLAHVQRACYQNQADENAKAAIKEIERQLLEYRYLFGNFFHTLRENKPEERMIRNQFLFVDQYFESIENKIHDWKES